MIKEVTHSRLWSYGVYTILRVDGMHYFRICRNMGLGVRSRYLVVRLACKAVACRVSVRSARTFKIGIFPPRFNSTVHRERKRAPQPRLCIVRVRLFLSLFVVAILLTFYPSNILENAQTQCSHAQHGGSCGEMHTPRPTSGCRRNWSCPGYVQRR